MNVLITDGLQRKALSVTRSLGKQGIQTFVGEKNRFSPAGWSKYCYKRIRYPDSQRKPKEFYRWLLKWIDETQCKAIFPMDDATIDIVMDNSEELGKKVDLLIPKQDSYNKVSDKFQTMQLADEVGIACPKTFMPETINEVKQLGEQLAFPLLIKPRKSSGSRGIRKASNLEDLLDQYKKIHHQYPFPLVQEYIPQGDRYDVCLLFNKQSELTCSFVQKELRHYPLKMGPSTVQESVRCPELIAESMKLLEGLNWIGVIEIEFMVDPRDGKAKLMEVNPRFWNSLELSIQCGVDFPYILYKIMANEPVKQVENYEIGRLCRWTIPGDFLHFVTNKNRTFMSPPFFSGKKHRLYDDTFSKADPLPAIANLLACFWYACDPRAWKMMTKR